MLACRCIYVLFTFIGRTWILLALKSDASSGPQAYFRQGVALQYLGRHADALAAFASGLAQDPKSLQLLVGMVEAAMKSPMRDTLEPTYQQLQKMKLDKSPFVVVSVVGQELLTAGHHGASVVVLEAALKIGTCSLKLRGSVFSALSSAHWSLGNTEKSTGYMQQDLDVAKTLGDHTGECRAHGNLGSAFFSKGNYREALTNHRHQLVLAMKLKDREDELFQQLTLCTFIFLIEILQVENGFIPGSVSIAQGSEMVEYEFSTPHLTLVCEAVLHSTLHLTPVCEAVLHSTLHLTPVCEAVIYSTLHLTLVCETVKVHYTLRLSVSSGRFSSLVLVSRHEASPFSKPTDNSEKTSGKPRLPTATWDLWADTSGIIASVMQERGSCSSVGSQ
ncbi:tetratricopeptide repeat protein 28 [Cricetulus griseus]|uniref:Tetratricopeptide repeat protein 28 n=1 Tax=Cricetulus griseus TaxID=10029 RepID=A0A061I8A0_CRIGR|nr:tetratricopeptide repeat protein 28 [Cricetulus griseus]